MSETATTRPPTRAPVNGSSVSSRGVLVSGAMAGVAVIGYGGTVLLANLMAAPQFREYAAAQMLVGMVGTFASAMIPMPLAHVIRTAPPGSAERRRGMAFAAVVCATLGVAAAAVTGSITSVFAPAAVVCAVAVSTGSLFVLSPVFGWLQGELRFARWTTVAVLEVAVRVVTAALAVLAGLGAAGAIGGFAVGVAAVLLLAPRAITRDLAWRPSVVVEKGRWTETAGIACTQLIVAAIVGADVVAVALLHGPAVESAGYQALSTLGKGPSYVAAGAAVVAFPLLRTRGAQVADILLATLRSFAMLAFPSAALVATVPGQLVLLVIPADYAGALRLLPVLAAAGVGYSGVTLLATLLVALRAYRRCDASRRAAGLPPLRGRPPGGGGAHGHRVGHRLGDGRDPRAGGRRGGGCGRLRGRAAGGRRTAAPARNGRPGSARTTARSRARRCAGGRTSGARRVAGVRSAPGWPGAVAVAEVGARPRV